MEALRTLQTPNEDLDHSSFVKEAQRTLYKQKANKQRDGVPRG